MRLIDADAFYKQFEEGRDGIAMIEALLPSELVDAVIGIYDEIKERLDATPTVDAVEVVRCKDCKHIQHDTLFGQYWCNGRKVTAEWYCADAERRSDE